MNMFKFCCILIFVVDLVYCDNVDPYYLKYFENIKTATSLEEFAKKHNVNVTLLFVKDASTFYDIHYSRPFQKNENALNLGDVKHEEFLRHIVNSGIAEGPRIAHSRDRFDTLGGGTLKSELYIPLFEIVEDYDSLNIQSYADASYIFCTDPFHIFQQENETDLCPATVNQVEYTKDGNVIKNITTYEMNHLYDFVICGGASDMPYYEQAKVLKLLKQAVKKHGKTEHFLSALVELLQHHFPGYIWSVHSDVGDTYAIDADKFVEIVDENDDDKKYLVHAYKM